MLPLDANTILVLGFLLLISVAADVARGRGHTEGGRTVFRVLDLEWVEAVREGAVGELAGNGINMPAGLELDDIDRVKGRRGEAAGVRAGGEGKGPPIDRACLVDRLREQPVAEEGRPKGDEEDKEVGHEAPLVIEGDVALIEAAGGGANLVVAMEESVHAASGLLALARAKGEWRGVTDGVGYMSWVVYLRLSWPELSLYKKRNRQSRKKGKEG